MNEVKDQIVTAGNLPSVDLNSNKSVTVDSEPVKEDAQNVKDMAKAKAGAMYDMLLALLPTMTPELKAQLVDLVKDAGVAAGDAALISLSQNIDNVKLGSLDPIVKFVVDTLVKEGRNLLHGGDFGVEVKAMAQHVMDQVKKTDEHSMGKEGEPKKDNDK